MRPYPRKLVETPNKEIPTPEQPVRSNSLKSSDYDQENQSPKSVLSAVGSDSLGSSDSDTPNGSSSPVSSTITGVHTSNFTLAGLKSPSEEAGLNTGSAHDEKPLKKFELSPKESFATKEDTAEDSSGRTLKLFGKTLLLVTDSNCRPSSPTIEAFKPVPVGVHVNCSSKEDDKMELQGHSRPRETSALSGLRRVRVRPETCGKGFLPYKRCIADR